MNVIRISIIIMLLFLAHVTFAQISGRVLDAETKAPLSGAHISVAKTKRIIATDFEGKFSFSEIMPGDYDLRITYIGYEEASVRVQVKEGSETFKEILLTPAEYEVAEAVVTGSRVQVSRNNTPLTVTVIPRQELEESGESAILPVISERVPGVFVTERGITGFGIAEGAAGQISIRGVSGSPNTRVLMLIDGHPQFMGIFGHPLPDSYVTSDAEKVEVIRGPASLLYGSNAMGGVINIITRKQQNDGWSGNARVSFGSYLTQKYMGSVGYKKGKFSVFASANHDETQGHRSGSEFYIDNGFLKLGYRINANFKVNVDGNIAKFKSYDPGTVDLPYTDPRHWIDILRGMGSVSIENSFNNAEGEIKYYYNFGEHKVYDGFYSTDHNMGLMMYESFKPFRKSTLTIGFDFQDNAGYAEQRNPQGEKVAEITDRSLSEAGTYLYYQQGIGNRIILTGGIRWQASQQFGTEWVPQAGISFLASENTTFKASASKGFRSPTIRELYLWAPANPDLKPESMWNYEAGWIQQFLQNKASIELTAYYSEGSNLIMTIGRFPNVKNENSGSFKHYGIEFAGRIMLFKSFSIHTNYAYLHMDDPIISAPAHQFFLGGKYVAGKFTFNANLNYIGELFTQISPMEEKEYYSILSAGIGYQVNHFLKAFVRGDNLLDRQYEINYGYPMPGITLFGGLEFSFRP